MKTKKVMDLNDSGTHLICIKTDEKYNPYRIYKVWSGHRRLLIKYGDFMSVIYFLRDFFQNGLDVMPLSEVLEWIRERSI